MGTLTLILGGARSGKSTWAERIARTEGGEHVLFVATAQPLDEEMRERIARHRSSRPPTWRTLETPRQVGATIRQAYRQERVIIVDCITVLVGNIFMDAPNDPVRVRENALAEADKLISVVQGLPAHTLIISNEVGMGIVPITPLGRAYRDILGEVNQRIAAAADNVYLIVAGIPLVVKGNLPGAKKPHSQENERST